MDPRSGLLRRQNRRFGREHPVPAGVQFLLRGELAGQMQKDPVMSQFRQEQRPVECRQFAVGGNGGENREPLARPDFDQGRHQQPVQQGRAEHCGVVGGAQPLDVIGPDGRLNVRVDEGLGVLGFEQGEQHVGWIALHAPAGLVDFVNKDHRRRRRPLEQSPRDQSWPRPSPR